MIKIKSDFNEDTELVDVDFEMSNSSNGEVISVICVLYEFLLEHGKTTKDIEREVIEMLKTSKDRKRDNK